VSLPVRFHPLVVDDLHAAWSWYELQQTGLGDRFLVAVEAAVRMVADWPDSGAPTSEADDGVIIERRIGTKGFPYNVRYRTAGDAIAVIAVYHQRRLPAFGTERVSDPQ
jgi:plasmid stabilization system protein ParE